MFQSLSMINLFTKMIHHNDQGKPMCTQLIKYELGNILGEGSFVKVRRAKNMETGQSLAIKVLNKERILNDKME